MDVSTTLGIPCIYYGSEQFFDGHGRNDRYIREAMFGGEFGTFGSRGRHFFNEESPAYRELTKVLKFASRGSRCGAGANICARSPGTASTSDSPK